MIEEAIESLMLQINPRTYGFKLPPKAVLPSITFFKVSAPRDQTQQGPSGLVSARFQITSWGRTYTESKLLSQEVRLAFDGFRGDMNEVRIDGVELMNELDQNEAEPNVFQTIMDFRVKYAERTN